MKQILIRDFHELKHFDFKLAACIGYFDGIHKGHQHLIKETMDEAEKRGVSSAMITFNPDPWTIITGKNSVNHITPMKEKVMILEQLGLDYLIVIEFSKDVAALSPQEFLEYYLIPLNVEALIVGEDFKFGYKGSGNIAYLKEHAKHHFDTVVLSIDKTNSKKIGTTLIVQSLLKGDIKEANELLGRDYEISGYVIHGRKQGRKIGFRTANMDVVDEYVIPAEGVYAGFVEVKGKKYQAMLSIGYNPTFNHTERLSVETHILDFDEEIYGELIKQSFVAKLRGQIKFNSVDELIVQMNHDRDQTREILNAREAQL